MKNWKAIALGHGLHLTSEQLARIIPPLDALEAAFRLLLSRLPYSIEPAITLSEAAVEATHATEKNGK